MNPMTAMQCSWTFPSSSQSDIFSLCKVQMFLRFWSIRICWPGSIFSHSVSLDITINLLDRTASQSFMAGPKSIRGASPEPFICQKSFVRRARLCWCRLSTCPQGNCNHIKLSLVMPWMTWKGLHVEWNWRLRVRRDHEKLANRLDVQMSTVGALIGFLIDHVNDLSVRMIGPESDGTSEVDAQ
jgi:hypothetical protein